MLEYSEVEIAALRDELSAACVVGVGYRLIVQPIAARTGMEAHEEAQFPTLAAAAASKGTSLAVKSGHEETRETHGSDVGVVVSAGPPAYSDSAEPWAKVGDVIVMGRYEGKRVELPPGSGNFYQFINDNHVLGRYDSEGITAISEHVIEEAGE